MFYELTKSGLIAEKQKALPLIYEEVKMEIGFRVDLMVENKVVVEIKSVEALTDVHTAQVITYLVFARKLPNTVLRSFSILSFTLVNSLKSKTSQALSLEVLIAKTYIVVFSCRYYIKLSSCKVGLLINFNVSSLKNGIKRIMN